MRYCLNCFFIFANTFESRYFKIFIISAGNNRIKGHKFTIHHSQFPMNIVSLITCSIETITNVFNEAFSDYLIPIRLTPEQLELKMKQESIDLNWSVGVFYDDKLVGFILNGYRDGILYNGGTGVIPAYRGQNLTAQMYDYLKPLAKRHHIKKAILEVITDNKRALHTYEKIGFTINRTFSCYKGKTPELKDISPSVEIKTVSILSWNEISNWSNMSPCWSGDNQSLQQIKNDLLLAGAFYQDKLVGYIAILPTTARIFQLIVDPVWRRKGIATSLLNYCFTFSSSSTMLALNVDENDKATSNFFHAHNWDKVVQQYEMILKI